MHISLARACACDPQDACIFTRPTCGLVQATVFAYLSRPEAQRVLVSCILLLSDQRDILLSRTERQLDICLSTYSVPTPPVQVFLQPVVPGQGVLGSWNHFFTFQVHWKSTCPGGKERSHHLGQVILLVQVGQWLLRQTLLGAQQVAMKHLFGGSNFEVDWKLTGFDNFGSEQRLESKFRGSPCADNAVTVAPLSKQQFDQFWGHSFLSVAQATDIKMPWEKGVFKKKKWWGTFTTFLEFVVVPMRRGFGRFPWGYSARAGNCCQQAAGWQASDRGPPTYW